MDEKYVVKGKYYPTIGIECHVQLKTKTKLFAGVNNDARDAAPNTLISPLCVGMPGTLPVLNGEAVTLAIRAGLALRAEIAEVSHFDRKHYFYPDLPLGYQITQFERPVVGAGVVEAPLDDGSYVTVRITRAHLEADAGKSTHPAGTDYSLVDLNRAGTPLLEIVSEPDIHTAEEARAYAHELYLLMKYADVSEADLYHGNMRFDVNVSVSTDPTAMGTRTETKNLNSFRSVEKAVEYEIKRQIDALEKGETIVQETRGWDDDSQKTFSQRSKEDAHDYRYFPDPDIPPITIDKTVVTATAETMPLLPPALRERFGAFGLDTAQINTILEEPELADMLRYTTEAHDTKTARTIANWCLGELQRNVGDGKLSWAQVSEAQTLLVKLASMVDENKLSSTAAKEILGEIITNKSEPEIVAKEKNLLQISDDSELVMIVEQVLSENEKAADDVRNGEMKAIGFLVGQVMKLSQGRANPAKVQDLIKKQLGV
jgi:aspartyl-tRNA(Asn)/glutamyl-tRNA(Gln) amidotransferase subunit B